MARRNGSGDEDGGLCLLSFPHLVVIPIIRSAPATGTGPKSPTQQTSHLHPIARHECPLGGRLQGANNAGPPSAVRRPRFARFRPSSVASHPGSAHISHATATTTPTHESKFNPRKGENNGSRPFLRSRKRLGRAPPDKPDGGFWFARARGGSFEAAAREDRENNAQAQQQAKGNHIGKGHPIPSIHPFCARVSPSCCACCTLHATRRMQRHMILPPLPFLPSRPIPLLFILCATRRRGVSRFSTRCWKVNKPDAGLLACC